MAKKITQKEIKGYVALAIIGGVIWVAVKLTDALGGIENIVAIGVLLLLVYLVYKIVSWGNAKRNLMKKRKMLIDKYNDNELVERIMNETIWQGQTSEQVVESLGPAEDIDQKVLKTKKKEVWKYGYEGGNRYRLRIILENDLVIGWDQR